MPTLAEILALEYTGDEAADFFKILKAHWFIMDERNTIADRAEALRDMSRRAFHYRRVIGDDYTIVNTYVSDIADTFGAANDV